MNYINRSSFSLFLSGWMFGGFAGNKYGLKNNICTWILFSSSSFFFCNVNSIAAKTFVEILFGFFTWINFYINTLKLHFYFLALLIAKVACNKMSCWSNVSLKNSLRAIKAHDEGHKTLEEIYHANGNVDIFRNCFTQHIAYLKSSIIVTLRKWFMADFLFALG